MNNVTSSEYVTSSSMVISLLSNYSYRVKV